MLAKFQTLTSEFPKQFPTLELFSYNSFFPWKSIKLQCRHQQMKIKRQFKCSRSLTMQQQLWWMGEELATQ
jgi:hypothetical protein